MAKTLVIDSHTGSRIPYLRGILTRSLQDSGLSFEKAYELASIMRDELAHTNKITSLDLRDRVGRHLKRMGKTAILERYSDRTLPAEPIRIIGHDGQSASFSKSIYRRYLNSTGIDADQANAIVTKFIETLLQNDQKTFTLGELDYHLYRLLKDTLGQTEARNYLVWRQFQASGRPLLLLIGGTAGAGKSTIANEAAHSLDIVRTQSTDMLREVMRMMIPDKLLPVLHRSSFSAWKALPKVTSNQKTINDDLLMDGYSTQAELLSVACEAVINRSLRERVSLILEGVHVRPTFLRRIPTYNNAATVMIMLAVMKPEQLEIQIIGRGKKAPDRRAKRYLSNFDHIWRLQSNLLNEADEQQVPIVINDNKDRVIREIMRIIVTTLGKDFTATPEEVFLDKR